MLFLPLRPGATTSLPFVAAQGCSAFLISRAMERRDKGEIGATSRTVVLEDD